MQIIKSCKCDESNANITNMLKQNLFIVTAYLNAFKINIHIPIDIQLSILYHIGSSIICKWQIYLFYITVNHQQYQHGQMTLHKLRKRISFYGCDPQVTCNSHLTLTRNTEDTTRGKAWRLLLGLDRLDLTNYQTQIKKGASKDYIKIRGDTKRTFLTSAAYNSRVPESRLIRLLNSFVQQYNIRYCQGLDAIAGLLLYAMPELPAFELFCSLVTRHIPLYFYTDKQRKHDLIGSYAGSYLAWDILKVCDKELFDHLKPLPAPTYLFPVTVSFQTINQPFTEVIKLWDFLFCFGFHLNPVMSAAVIIVRREHLLLQTPATKLFQGLLSSRVWMNGSTDARKIVHCTMKLIETLKQSQHHTLWNNVLYHATNMDVARSIKLEHEIDENIRLPPPIGSRESALPSSSQSMYLNNEDVMDECHNAKVGVNTDDVWDAEYAESTMNDPANLVIDKTTDAQTMGKNEDNITEEEISNDSIPSTASTSNNDDDDSDSSSGWSIISTLTDNDIRVPQLNEFELKDEQIELFRIYEIEHNQLLSEHHVKFVQSQNEYITMDCVDDDLIQYWK